jgi:ParB family transcriptional regulator, chromosome partitioning protein
MATQAEVIGESVFDLPLEQIIPSKNNPRKNIDEDSLAELALSIGKDGVLSPILARPVDGGRHEIVFGERRWRASKLAGKETIPAIIREMTDEQAEEERIVENLQRADLDPLEEAQAFKRLMGKGTVADVAAKLGKEEAYIAKRLKLLAMIPEAQKALQAGKIQLGHALEISRLNPEDQKRTLKFCQPSETQMGSGTSWETVKTSITVESLKQFIQNNLLVELKNARFDLADPTLDKKMGACTACPHNTANQGALFSDVKNARCTLPECFFGKTNASLEREIEAVATETGKKVFRLGIGNEHGNRGLSKAAVDGYFSAHSTAIAEVEKGKECESSLPAVVTYVDPNLNSKATPGKRITICIDEKCKVHHGAASRSSGGVPKPLKGLEKVEHKAEVLAENLGQRVRDEAYKQLAEKLLAQAKLGGKKESFACLTAFVRAHLHLDRFRDAGKALGLPKPEKREYGGPDWESSILAHFEKNPSALILAIVAAEGLQDPDADSPLYRMAAEYKVDVKKIEKAIASEDKESIKGMRERAEAKAKPPKAKKKKKAKAAKAPTKKAKKD